jgi:hypothetical protein
MTEAISKTVAFHMAEQRYQRAIAAFDCYDADDIPDELFIRAEEAMEQVIDAGNKLLAANLFTPEVQAHRQGLADAESDLAMVKRSRGQLH